MMISGLVNIFFVLTLSGAGVSGGHALQYADGKPFFMVGDTWLAGTTWRHPCPFSGGANT
jgi:hypothetical protein